MIRTLTSLAASEAPRLMAVVVLPTPPFWFVMAITRPKRHCNRIMCPSVHQSFTLAENVSRETPA